MKYTLLFILSLVINTAALSSHAITIIADEYINIEGAHIEILHNTENQQGTVIVRQPGCDTCTPITLSYSGLPNFSINGHIAAFDGNSPTIGRGDISYKKEDMSLGHVNMYRQ